ncbi:MAG: hypothetical protein GY774_08485 [Planctomycetes bacterium]|nr:hypothetical protein [Planctomycetota bacterium]
MRQTRTSDETWAIACLLAHLHEAEPGWTENPAFQDKPDLVLDGPGGMRAACELSTVGINEWYRWKNDHRLKLDVDKLDSMIVPREPNIWLEHVIAAKNPKVGEYKSNASANEVWLIVHSAQAKPYDFFVLDAAYDLPLMQEVAGTEPHEFSRIYIVSSTAGVAKVHPADPSIGSPPKLGQGTLLQLELRLIKKQAWHGGRIPVAIGREVSPDRQVVLQPLGHYPAKA